MSTEPELMNLAQEWCDMERRMCIGKAQGFDVRDAKAAFMVALRESLAAVPRESEGRDAARIDQMLAECLPGGDSCDPQQVADSVRAWFAGKK